MKKVALFLSLLVTAVLIAQCSTNSVAGVDTTNSTTTACAPYKKSDDVKKNQMAKHQKFGNWKKHHRNKPPQPPVPTPVDTCRSDETIYTPVTPLIVGYTPEPDWSMGSITVLSDSNTTSLGHAVEYGYWADAQPVIHGAVEDSVIWGNGAIELPMGFSFDAEFYLWVKARCSIDKCVVSEWSQPVHFKVTATKIEIIE